MFDITLSNQGAPVSALTLKVECSVEGGSTAVLHDNPLQQLPFNAQEQLRVQTDIKEQGLITIVASAVFTGVLSWVPVLPDGAAVLTCHRTGHAHVIDLHADEPSPRQHAYVC